MKYPDLNQLIDGQWIPGSGPLSRPIVNPATGELLGQYHQASEEDLSRAVSSAEQGFDAWRQLSPEQRQVYLERVASLIRERADDIAAILSAEEGKRFPEAQREVLRSASIISWDAAEGRRLYGRILPAEAGMRHQVLREPAGVVAAMIAWNFPVGFMARKVGGALAAGCSVILKATEETPGTCVAYLSCFVDAGLPAGSVNLVMGEPGLIARQLIEAPAVRVVTFTGSTAVGKLIGELCARTVTRSVLELGGHAPVLIADDANIELAIATSLTAKFQNNAGQICVAPTRFFVARRHYDAFSEALAKGAREIRVGPASDPESQMGPLVHERRLAAIDDLVKDAVQHGARLLAGGHRLERPGCFYAPTVLADVPQTARAMREEPFGPLALVHPVDSLDEAIELANSLPYALAAYAFTESARTAQLLTERVKTGMLSINHMTAAPPGAPFGGVKESGHGREGGIEGLQEFTNVKFVSHKVY